MMRRSTPFDDLFERMNRQFDEMGRGFETAADRDISLDLSEHDDRFVLTADVPGFEKEDIDLSLSERTLTITANREYESDEDTAEYIRRERAHASLRRTIRLPATVREADTTASYKNGVLTVTLPKAEVDADERHRIDIE